MALPNVPEGVVTPPGPVARYSTLHLREVDNMTKAKATTATAPAPAPAPASPRPPRGYGGAVRLKDLDLIRMVISHDDPPLAAHPHATGPGIGNRFRAPGTGEPPGPHTSASHMNQTCQPRNFSG
jgi:hypothetical protein